jgi:cytochrome c oxidase subunit 2
MNKRIIPFLLLATALSAGSIYFMFRVYNIPGAASVQRGSIDNAIKTLISIAALVFIWVVTALVYVVAFHRRKEGDGGFGAPITGNRKLEAAWTIIPLLIVIGVSIYGGVILQDITPAPPAGVLNVDVTAFRWGWKFYYPDYNVNSLYLELEVNRQVEFHMVSLDVVHGFWIQQFGPKEDIVPGLTMHLDVTPDKIGQYLLVCDQLCGAGHTDMTAPVYVVSTGDFQTWAAQHKAPPATTPPSTGPSTAGLLSQQGATVFSSDCASCHGSSGQGGVGPRLIGPGNTLAKYANAQALLDFMSTAMPLNAPGSLNAQQYDELLAFILVQNNIAQPGAVFDPNSLASVAIK